MILTVTVPSTEVFAAYYYGNADDLRMKANEDGTFTFTLVYEDSYLARYQEGRFASGMYFGRLLEGEA
jgi:hypothetical protein